jgi:hypothetical protein
MERGSPENHRKSRPIDVLTSRAFKERESNFAEGDGLAPGEFEQAVVTALLELAVDAGSEDVDAPGAGVVAVAGAGVLAIELAGDGADGLEQRAGFRGGVGVDGLAGGRWRLTRRRQRRRVGWRCLRAATRSDGGAEWAFARE